MKKYLKPEISKHSYVSKQNFAELNPDGALGTTDKNGTISTVFNLSLLKGSSNIPRPN